MWKAVAIAVIEQDRKDMDAARRSRCQDRIAAVEADIRAYYASPDYEVICDYAGIAFDPATVIAAILAGGGKSFRNVESAA